MEYDFDTVSTIAFVATVPLMYFTPTTAFFHCHFNTSY